MAKISRPTLIMIEKGNKRTKFYTIKRVLDVLGYQIVIKKKAMKNKQSILLPKMQHQLELVGENIKLARLRRKFSSQQVAERAGISLKCLSEVEKGTPDISIGTYTLVLRVLNLDGDVYKIAENDILGRKLQDIELLKNV